VRAKPDRQSTDAGEPGIPARLSEPLVRAALRLSDALDDIPKRRSWSRRKRSSARVTALQRAMRTYEMRCAEFSLEVRGCASALQRSGHSMGVSLVALRAAVDRALVKQRTPSRVREIVLAEVTCANVMEYNGLDDRP